jgi:hypothetical protein
MPWLAARGLHLPAWSPQVPLTFGFGIIAVAILLASGLAHLKTGVQTIAAATALVLICCQCAIFIPARGYYDLTEISRKISTFQKAGRTVAVVDDYHGQFNFLGRLEKPLTVVSSPEDALKWGESNPSGILVTICKPGRPLPDNLLHLQNYRGKLLALWPVSLAEQNKAQFHAAQ